MRLSEHNQRVLAEFESGLRDSDPSLVLQFQHWTAELAAAVAPFRPGRPTKVSAAGCTGRTVVGDLDEHKADAPAESRVTDGY